MPNHFTNIAICRRNFDSDKGEAFTTDDFNKAYGNANLCELLRPFPTHKVGGGSDAVLEWQRDNWGVKWGTYDVEAFQLPGDGSPVAIAFCTAYTHPKPMLDKIAEWIKSECGMKSVAWVGSDPYDDSTATLGGDWIKREA